MVLISSCQQIKMGYIKNEFKLKKIKIGHAGTLDPLASGLLVICTGKFTKKIPEFQGQEKEYTGTITLGGTTPSYDLETAISDYFPIDHLTNDLILDTTNKFIGTIQQRPPVFPALKKDGKRSMRWLEKEGSRSSITHSSYFNLRITRIELPEMGFRVVCSKGTYIRSLALISVEHWNQEVSFLLFEEH